jgi:hypothetical protein
LVIHNNKKNEIVDFGYDSDYDNNEIQSDLPIEDLRSVDSPTEEQFSFQNDYDFSQTPEGDFSSDLVNKEITIT